MAVNDAYVTTFLAFRIVLASGLITWATEVNEIGSGHPFA